MNTTLEGANPIMQIQYWNVWIQYWTLWFQLKWEYNIGQSESNTGRTGASYWRYESYNGQCEVLYYGQ